jgi:hypothetical protein
VLDERRSEVVRGPDAAFDREAASWDWNEERSCTEDVLKDTAGEFIGEAACGKP